MFLLLLAPLWFTETKLSGLVVYLFILVKQEERNLSVYLISGGTKDFDIMVLVTVFFRW